MMRAGVRVPKTLCIELTTRCNGSCMYCAMALERPDPIDMDLDTFKYIIDAVPGRQDVWPVSFGESLLYPGIVEAVAYATQNGKRAKLVTNGALLDRQMSRALLGAGLRALRVSVDAPSAEIYQELRPGLSWGTLVDNVRAFVEERDRIGAQCYVVARATLSGPNLESAGAIKQFWRKVGCSVIVKLAVYVPTRDDRDRIDGKPRPCRWPLSTMMVKANGGAVLCCKDWWGNFAVGSIHDLSPMEIFNGLAFGGMRRAMGIGRGVPSICTRCGEVWHK